MLPKDDPSIDVANEHIYAGTSKSDIVINNQELMLFHKNKKKDNEK